MKFIKTTPLKSKSYREHDIGNGHFVIGSGQTGNREFPFYHTVEAKAFFEKKLKEKFQSAKKLKYGYLQRYAEYKAKLDHLEGQNVYEKFKIDIPEEKHGRRVYEARLFIEGGHTNSYSLETSKVRVIDVDTGAYYSLSVEGVTELLYGMIEGSVTVEEGILKAKVFPYAVGGTCFLGIYNTREEEKESIKKEYINDSKDRIVKKKDLKRYGIYYDKARLDSTYGCYRRVYLGECKDARGNVGFGCMDICVQLTTKEEYDEHYSGRSYCLLAYKIDEKYSLMLWDRTANIIKGTPTLYSLDMNKDAKFTHRSRRSQENKEFNLPLSVIPEAKIKELIEKHRDITLL